MFNIKEDESDDAGDVLPSNTNDDVTFRHHATSFDFMDEERNLSLLPMENVEINKLTDSEKVELFNFIDFTDCELEIAMEYLPMYNWNAQTAMGKYFEDNPHPVHTLIHLNTNYTCFSFLCLFDNVLAKITQTDDDF